MPREDRDALLDEFERSGLSGNRFAAKAGVKYQTFCAWVRKRRGTAGSNRNAAPGKVRWLEATVESRGGGGGDPLEVDLPCGARLRIASREQAVLAAELLSHLGAAKC